MRYGATRVDIPGADDAAAADAFATLLPLFAIIFRFSLRHALRHAAVYAVFAITPLFFACPPLSLFQRRLFRHYFCAL